MVKNKTLIICLDGATFDLINPLLEKEGLPHLSSLIKNGTHNRLLTIRPPLTAPAWASFITGKNPGKHSVFDFVNLKFQEEVKVVNSSSLKAESLWSIFSRHGKKLGVINIPLTYPPEEINGFMISGMMCPEPTSYPSTLIAEINQYLGRNYTSTPKIMAHSREEYLQVLLEDHAEKEDTVLYLMQNKEWDVFMVFFTLTDHVAHRFFKSGLEKVEAAYSRVDETIGRMLQLVDRKKTDIIVMSDHGFGRCDKTVNINNYFIEKGFIQFTSYGKIKYFLFKHDLSPKRVYSLASKIDLNRIFNKMSFATRKKIAGKFLSYTDLDVEKTLCYSKGSFGQIHLNKKAFPFWNLTYEQARQQVISALEELKDEKGEKLVDEIFTKEQMYHGPYNEEGADLFLMMKSMSYITFSQFSSSNKLITDSVYTNEWEGTHRLEGIFIASGPSFKEGISFSTKNLLDVPKTLLYLYGLEAESKDMDGEVLLDALKRPIKQEKSSEKNIKSDLAEKEKIKKALAGIKL